MAEKSKKNKPYLNQRIGLIGELLVQKVAVQYVDFCFRTCTGHPADLIIDHQNKLYRVQVKTRHKSTTNGKQQYCFEYGSRSKVEAHNTYPIEIYAFCFMPEGDVEFKAYNSDSFTNYITEGKHLNKNTGAESLQNAFADLNKTPEINISDYIQ